METHPIAGTDLFNHTPRIVNDTPTNLSVLVNKLEESGSGVVTSVEGEAVKHSGICRIGNIEKPTSIRL